MKARTRPPPGQIARSIKGVAQIIQTKNGQYYARPWPKKQGTPQSYVNQLNTSVFSQLVGMMKVAPTQDMSFAIEWTEGTSLLWRDVLMATYSGNLFRFSMADGSTIYGAGQVSSSIQALLDSISNVPGTILGRTSAGWQALIPGPANFVLTSNGEGNPPLWAPPQGGGGGGAGFGVEFGDDLGPSGDNTRTWNTTYTSGSLYRIVSTIIRTNNAQDIVIYAPDAYTYSFYTPGSGIASGLWFIVPPNTDYNVEYQDGSGATILKWVEMG